MRHGCMVYTEHAETVAVTRGTSHAGAVSTPPRWIFKHALWKASHSYGITCEGRECARERRITLYKSHHQQQQQHANQKVQGQDFRMCLWWSLCTLYSHDSRWELPWAIQVFVVVLCYVFPALINSLLCWFSRSKASRATTSSGYQVSEVIHDKYSVSKTSKTGR